MRFFHQFIKSSLNYSNVPVITSSALISCLYVNSTYGSATSDCSDCKADNPYVSGERLGRGVKLNFWKSNHKNVEILDFDNEMIQLNLTPIRNKDTQGQAFLHAARKLLLYSLEFALCELIDEDTEVIVQSPSGLFVEGIGYEKDLQFCGLAIDDRQSVVSPILKDIFQACLPIGSFIGNIVIESIDPSVSQSGKLIKHCSLPKNISDCYVIIYQLELPSFQSCESAIRCLLAHGVSEDQILILTLATCPEVTDEFTEAFPKARLVSSTMDISTNEHGQLIPGLGDFMSRYALALGQNHTAPASPSHLDSIKNFLFPSSSSRP